MVGRRGRRGAAFLNLTAPQLITFGVAFLVALFALVIALKVITNPFPTIAVVWFALLAYAILAIGNLVDGL